MIGAVKKKNIDGLTLVELTFAAVLMILTFVGVLSTYIQCSNLTEISRESSTAMLAAKSRMEEIRNSTFAGLDGFHNTFVLDSGGIDGSVVSYVDLTSTRVKQITISVSYVMKNGRIIGEDTNLDGDLDAGEDQNANGRIDSPIQLITSVYNTGA